MRFSLFLTTTLSLLLTHLGCSTTEYRQQADADANCLLDQKAAVAGSLPEDFRITIDPRSRMFDPFDPDCEPMPPDDPLAHSYMQCVDCKRGSSCWQTLPKTEFVENPAWLEYLPRDEDQHVRLDLRGAVETGLLHSRQYQEELEELYLSALDVSFERFRFDTQFFGGSEVFFTADGSERSGTGDSSSLLEVSAARPDNRWRVERLTATGGELVAGFANTLMWQFAGPNDYSSATLLDFSVVQPLLRGAGRTRVLERLTISERSLLANVRSMERFRRGFYLSLITGNDPGRGPSRQGGFFGGSGLEGFRGIGGGGFGGVGNFGFNGGQQNGGGFTGGAGAQGAGGFLGLLQNTQQIRNQRANVLALRESVEQLKASYEAGRIDRFQVELAQQALLNGQSQLLSSETFYESSLDNYKITLGLPPELPVKIDDPLLNRFQLLDPQLEEVQQQVSDLLAELRLERAEAAKRKNENGEVAAAELLPPIAWTREIEELRQQAELRLAAVDTDFLKLKGALPRRAAALERLASRPESQAVRIEPRLLDKAQPGIRTNKRLVELDTLKERFQQTWNLLRGASEQTDSQKQLEELIAGLEQLSAGLLELSLVQAGTRLESIAFVPVDLMADEAVQLASFYRRDWQNARASLVDRWRLIYFNANDLKSDLGIVFSGDLGNVGDHPFRFRDTQGRLRVGLRFDAPLTRVSERNVYRQSLIEYQQARRNYYEFRDRVAQGLRSTLRQLRLNEVNFELRRAAVQVAISQVDLARLRLSQPPKPEEDAQFGATLARDLVQSLTDLQNVQNDFLSVWVNYEVQRLNLEYQLGLMELDPTGVRLEQDVPYRALLANVAEKDPELAALPALTLSNPAAVGIPGPLQMPESIAANQAIHLGGSGTSDVLPASHQQENSATVPAARSRLVPLPVVVAPNIESPASSP